MKKIKRLTDLIPLLLLWAVLCAFFWGKVFMVLTDTAPEKKITLFIDAAIPRAGEMTMAMEERPSDIIRMVKVHPFTYAMMGNASIEAADLYIVSAANLQTYQDWFAPLPQSLINMGETLAINSVPCALEIFDGQTGAAASYISYTNEAYYLCLGKNAPHREDNEAILAALHLLTLP